MKVHKTVAKFLLACIGRVLGPRLSVAAIRFILTRLRLPGRLSQFLRWPITTHMLPANYTEDVMLRNGIVMRVGLDDGINRRLLYYSRHFELCWEPQTARLVLQLVHDRDVVIVGGAHIGYHALLIAYKLEQMGGQVHAFEPVLKFFERLEASKQLNRFQQLYLKRMVLSERSGEMARIYTSKAWPSIVAPDRNVDARYEEVPSTTLDDYVEQQEISKVALILLDVEGAEYEVLHGANRLLSSTAAPDLIFEMNRPLLAQAGLSESDLYRYLLDRGYSLFAIRDEYISTDTVPFHMIEAPIDLIPVQGPSMSEFNRIEWFNVYAAKNVARLEELAVVVRSTPFWRSSSYVLQRFAG